MLAALFIKISSPLQWGFRWIHKLIHLKSIAHSKHKTIHSKSENGGKYYNIHIFYTSNIFVADILTNYDSPEHILVICCIIYRRHRTD